MSASTVTEETISAIVAFAAQNGNFNNQGLTKLGQDLWDANYASVNYLYNENTPAPKFEYNARSTVNNLPPLHVYKICRYFNYQTSEHPDWYKSETFETFDAIKEKALSLFLLTCPEFENAPWGL